MEVLQISLGCGCRWLALSSGPGWWLVFRRVWALSVSKLSRLAGDDSSVADDPSVPVLRSRWPQKLPHAFRSQTPSDGSNSRNHSCWGRDFDATIRFRQNTRSFT